EGVGGMGLGEEGGGFGGWVVDTFEHGAAPKIMYATGGGPIPDERIDDELEGYRRSAPVRWGNGAADQLQHDVYGEVLDCAYQWVKAGGQLDPALWDGLGRIADLAGQAWRGAAPRGSGGPPTPPPFSSPPPPSPL